MTFDPATPNRSPDAAASVSRQDFDRQFLASYRVLWLIAAGVTGNRSHADDVVQEAAMIALGKLDQFTPGTNFTAWMGQMVRNVAMNFARKEYRRRAATIGEDGVSDVSDPNKPHAGDSPVDRKSGRLADDQDHFDDAVVRALNELTDVARACLLLKTIEGMDYAEISTLLDIPAGTAMSHVHRSRKQLGIRLTSYRATGARRQALKETMTNQTEKLDRWMNAYLDGALPPAEAARFESVIDRNPKLREMIETHRDIEASLKRTFAPPRQAPRIPAKTSRETIPMPEGRAEAATAEKPRKKSRGILKGLATAATIGIVAWGAYWGWENQSIFTGKDIRMARFYAQAKATDFKVKWKCESDQQFQTTFWYQLGTGAALAARTPPNIEVKGIQYGNTLSDKTVHLMATVDGKGVVVFVDRIENDRQDRVAGAGLNAFRKKTEHLIFVEVSPLDEPHILDLLRETDIPKKWQEEMDLPTENTEG